jgi:transcriptional regulator with XRE-family HTH domain
MTTPDPVGFPPIDRHRLRRLREARYLSRERLAVAAGISSRAVAATELGESCPSPATVSALAAALGIEPTALAIESAASDDRA